MHSRPCHAAAPGTTTLAVPAADVLTKAVLVLFLALVIVDPSWGNLEGKAPTQRALTYPLVAFAIPLWWLVARPRAEYPWLADLLLTLTGFSDILGNRLDLYDNVVWFDDWMHFMNLALIAAAVVLLWPPRSVGWLSLSERAVAAGLTASLIWEVFEYYSFVTRSSEYAWAYSDTLGDLVLGWLGAVLAATAVHLGTRPRPPRPGRHPAPFRKATQERDVEGLRPAD